MLWVVPLCCAGMCQAELWAAPVWGSEQPLLCGVPESSGCGGHGGFPGYSQCWSVSGTLRPCPRAQAVMCERELAQVGSEGLRTSGVWVSFHCATAAVSTEQLWAGSGPHHCRAEPNLQLHGQSRDHCLAWCQSPSLSWNQYSAGISCGVIGSLAIFGALLRAPSLISHGYIKISVFVSRKFCPYGGKLDNVTQHSVRT